MRARIERNLRTAFGVLTVLGVMALPQASWAQVHQVSGHYIGVKTLALSGGDGIQAATTGGPNIQNLRTWLKLKLSVVYVWNGTINVPPAFRPRKLEIVNSNPLEQ